MQDLRVIGVENGALLVASDDGTRFRIPIDELMQSKLRQTIPDANAGRKMSPREIQAHIRSGMSAQDVSDLTGVPLDYITRFEGPVLAEREFVVTSALNVAVQTGLEVSPFTQGMTFGSAIRQRLVSLNAVNERWASWKEEGSGWVVKLSFTADHIDHDARWSFEPKKNVLLPLNNEAVALSQQGTGAGSLIPRLRVVPGRDADRTEAPTAAQTAEREEQTGGFGEAQPDPATATDAPATDSSEPELSRFDSGAFDLAKHDTQLPGEEVRHAVLSRFAPAVNSTASTKSAAAASGASARTVSTTSTVSSPATNQTADLLEALRRRRGERESASYREDDELAADSDFGQPSPSADSTPAGIRLIDVPLEKYLASDTPQKATAPQPTTPAKAARKGRTAMPSWDDIVFGARPDDLS